AFVPVVHGVTEALGGLGGGGQLSFFDRWHHPVAFLAVAGLRALIVVDGPKQRQSAVLVARPQRRQVCRVDDEHGVKLEADRPWEAVGRIDTREWIGYCCYTRRGQL